MTTKPPLQADPGCPNKIDLLRVERGDWCHADRDTECSAWHYREGDKNAGGIICGRPYRDHPIVPGIEWLHRLCDGRLVKLCEVDQESIEAPRCEGDHYFENRCNACGGSQPDGPCEVCPHIGPQVVCSAEHFARRPCRHCGSSDLRTVRVKAPL